MTLRKRWCQHNYPQCTSHLRHPNPLASVRCPPPWERRPRARRCCSTMAIADSARAVCSSYSRAKRCARVICSASHRCKGTSGHMSSRNFLRSRRRIRSSGSSQRTAPCLARSFAPTPHSPCSRTSAARGACWRGWAERYRVLYATRCTMRLQPDVTRSRLPPACCRTPTNAYAFCRDRIAESVLTFAVHDPPRRFTALQCGQAFNEACNRSGRRGQSRDVWRDHDPAITPEW